MKISLQNVQVLANSDEVIAGFYGSDHFSRRKLLQSLLVSTPEMLHFCALFPDHLDRLWGSHIRFGRAGYEKRPVGKAGDEHRKQNRFRPDYAAPRSMMYPRDMLATGMEEGGPI